MSTKLDRKFISLSETDNHMAILVLTKGQLISECLLDFLNIPKNHRK